jgi:hypothetical protein
MLTKAAADESKDPADHCSMPNDMFMTPSIVHTAKPKCKLLLISILHRYFALQILRGPQQHRSFLHEHNEPRSL